MKQVFWMVLGAIIAAAIGAATAQGPVPNVIPGCVYNSSAPTLTNGQSTVLQCDSSGRLKVTTS